MKIDKILRKINWLGGLSHGYACGYIGVPPEHPWYKQEYDDIECTVHGGLTYAGFGVPGTESDKSLWYVGFDTAHGGDNIHNCSKAYCEQELEQLYQQALKASR